MWIFDIIDIILIVVIILCEFFICAFFIGCRIAYKKGFEDGRENSWRKQPLRDIDKKGKARKMKREIKFRGKSLNTNCWVYGDLRQDKIRRKAYVEYEVDPETVGQYTGLKDKNGKEIYEGDIIEYYDLETYCINPDCDAHLLGYGSRLRKKVEVVKFDDGIFGVGDDSDHPLTPLTYCGIYEEMLNDMKEDTYLMTNGYNIDNSIVGVKVIGNIHENPELMK